MSSLLRRLAGLFRGANAGLRLVVVTRNITGATVEETLDRFEDALSEENFQDVSIQEQVERSDGLLVRYEVRWKYSVFDDSTSGSHVSWALLASTDPVAGDPPGSRFRVAAATAEHHMREMSVKR